MKVRRSKQAKHQRPSNPQIVYKATSPLLTHNVPIEENTPAIPQQPIAIMNLQERQTTKKINKENDHLNEKLKKQFKKFSTLPVEGLMKISDSMALYIEEKKKDMDHKDGQFVRFSFRNEILKILLISVLQLNDQNTKIINVLQEKLLDENDNAFQMLAIIAHNLQCYLYQELFNPKQTKARLQPYQCQIKLLIASLNDINNFALRRGILNGTISYEFIKSASQEQMMSEETKRKEKERMIQEVRQSQVWEERDFNKKPEEKSENIAQKKEKEETRVNHLWACEKVEEMKNALEEIGKIWLRRQKELEGHYGKFKRSARINKQKDD